MSALERLGCNLMEGICTGNFCLGELYTGLSMPFNFTGCAVPGVRGWLLHIQQKRPLSWASNVGYVGVNQTVEEQLMVQLVILTQQSLKILWRSCSQCASREACACWHSDTLQLSWMNWCGSQVKFENLSFSNYRYAKHPSPYWR